MPSRFLTLGIVALWLTAVGWGAYRAWGREPGPPPLLDRTDEVGKQTARWLVLLDGAEVGHVQTAVGRAGKSPLFALHASFSFGEGFRYQGMPLKVLKSTYGVTPRGRLRQVGYDVAVGQLNVVLKGWVEGDRFTAQVRRANVNQPVDVHVATPGRPLLLLNLLHPPHRMSELYEGRRWQAVGFDPLQSALAEGAGGDFDKLEATTAADRLPWAEKSEPCWRVDFRDGDKVRARVWARMDDGLVLRQEANSAGMRFDVQREPDHAPRGGVPGLKLPGLGR